MTFAELRYESHYSEMHHELVEALSAEFPDVQSGLQGDSWIWVVEGGEKVAVDTFSSMKHEVKADAADSTLAKKVIQTLSRKYDVLVYETPKPD